MAISARERIAEIAKRAGIFPGAELSYDFLRADSAWGDSGRMSTRTPTRKRFPDRKPGIRPDRGRETVSAADSAELSRRKSVVAKVRAKDEAIMGQAKLMRATDLYVAACKDWRENMEDWTPAQRRSALGAIRQKEVELGLEADDQFQTGGARPTKRVIVDFAEVYSAESRGLTRMD